MYLGMQKVISQRNIYLKKYDFKKFRHFSENRVFSLYVYFALAYFIRLWKSPLAWLSNKNKNI